MEDLRSKSLLLTAYAEHLLNQILEDQKADEPAFRIITPKAPAERGAQLSLLLRQGLLEKVQGALSEAGVVCDQRKPDVVRVARCPCTIVSRKFGPVSAFCAMH